MNTYVIVESSHARGSLGYHDEARCITYLGYESWIATDSFVAGKPALENVEPKERKVTSTRGAKDVWCFKCKSHGNDKDRCPIFKNYIIGGGLYP